MRLGRLLARLWPLLGCASVLAAAPSYADSWEQAKRMHDRLTGIPASEAVLKEMKALIEQKQYTEAAYKAMENDAFYRAQLFVLKVFVRINR